MAAAVRAGVPGVLAGTLDSHGIWRATAGVGDLRTHKPRGTGDSFRIGSVTKSFTSTVLLQLEAEGRLSLEDTVDHWLPGQVRGHGHDGRKITLRQLLNQTSGIADFVQSAEFTRKYIGAGFLKHRYDSWTPRQVLRLAMGQRPVFAPGTSWGYSNTNYILAGMVIKKVTGHSYTTEVQRRILRPLGLTSTKLPGDSPRMTGRHGHAYSKLLLKDPAAKVYDTTELNPSWGSSAGEMISTTRDLNRFYRAVLGGRLLPRPQLKEMLTTVPTSKETPRLRYGLGLQHRTLSCGTQVYGHGGGIHGSETMAAVTRDGRHAASFNLNSDWVGDLEALLEAEFCGK
ncbi:beta-lactamase family protein [Streptomyces sp. MST-110588]|nr:beta-lactamase family protein [Streptomyces sp. MST-110588]